MYLVSFKRIFDVVVRLNIFPVSDMAGCLHDYHHNTHSIHIMVSTASPFFHLALVLHSHGCVLRPCSLRHHSHYALGLPQRGYSSSCGAGEACGSL
jgi:hypothetical protein